MATAEMNLLKTTVRSKRQPGLYICTFFILKERCKNKTVHGKEDVQKK